MQPLYGTVSASRISEWVIGFCFCEESLRGQGENPSLIPSEVATATCLIEMGRAMVSGFRWERRTWQAHGRKARKWSYSAGSGRYAGEVVLQRTYSGPARGD